jgi:HAD superfamily hydrolase (TIGR01490 family)
MGMENQQKQVAFFDVDNTLLQGSTIFLLGRGMYKRGFFTRKEISHFFLINLLYLFKGTEDKGVIEKVQEAACNFIRGHKVDDLEQLGSEVYDEFVSPALWQGAINIAQEHLNAGREVWLVTASPQDMASLMANRLGFSGALGTCAKVENGVYTGEIEGSLLHGVMKKTAVEKLAAERNFDLKNSYAYSDSHHDLPLLNSVGNPAAINPDGLLYLAAKEKHWPIYDFRRNKKLKAIFAPALARIGSKVIYLLPRRRGRS